MGRLGWDITDDPGVDDPYFPDPQGKLADYAAKHVGFALIEESYVNTATSTFTQIQQSVPDAFVRDGSSVLKFHNVWLGDEAAMLDWTNPAGRGLDPRQPPQAVHGRLRRASALDRPR